MRFLLLVAALIALQGSASAHVINPVALLAETWNLIEGGEKAPFVILTQNEVLATGGPSALGTTVTAVGELAWPRPNSACGHTKLINNWVDIKAGTASPVRVADALDSYAAVVAQAIDNLVILGLPYIVPAPWPVLDNTCGDYGRLYEFEELWADRPVGVSKALKCLTARLYTSFSAVANNVGAATSSAITGPSIDLFGALEVPFLEYLRLVTDNSPAAVVNKEAKLKHEAAELKLAVFQTTELLKAKYVSLC